MIADASRFLSMAVLAAVLLAPASATGQFGTETKVPELMSLRPDLKRGSTSTLESIPVAMDGPVLPDEYFVGPGDGVSLNIWSSVPMEHDLTVTPEGYLLIPAVGAVPVAGKTLTMVRDTVYPLVKRKYPSSKVSLTLVTPRRVSVRIEGQVMNEGAFEMTSVQRIHHLIEEANRLPSTQVTPEFYDVTLQDYRRQASQRYIVVKHRDGTTDRVDLVRYSLSGAARHNPYLREGDVVFIPRRLEGDNRIAVYGGVTRIGSIEYAEGDSLSFLLRLGLGFTPRAQAHRAVFTRLTPDAKRMDSVTVDAAGILLGAAPDIALRPGDRVVVPEDQDPRSGNAVSVEGEVLRPGTYPITPSSTSLAETIEMAGGFTPEAYLRGGLLLRARVQAPNEGEAALERERLLGMRSSLPADDSTYYLAETALRLQGEVVSVDFERLFTGRDSTEDVTLRNFDRIVIPARQHTVYVFGQVVSPGHIPLAEGGSVAHYIGKAGGFTEHARDGDVVVIKASSRAWLAPGETQVEDGDYIWVPRETSQPFGFYLTTIVQLATVLASLATVILVIQNL